MSLRIVASTLATLVVAGCAVAQTPKADEDHSAHHPPGSPAAVATPAPRTAAAPDAFDKQMKAMQDMHQRMQSAKTPAERTAMMDEHMKLMQSGMAMMGQMRGMGSSGGMGAMGSTGAMSGPGIPGGMGMMPSQPPASGAAQGAPGMQGMAGMMGMHQQMERRMAMMEQMMQMMVDREAAMPRK